MARTDGSITVGCVQDNTSTPLVRVDGQSVYIPNIAGSALQVGQSVTLMRMPHGRYQLIGQAGQWAPAPALP